MALARYSDSFWYPDGTLAASVPARVFLLSSSTLAALWTDVTGTVALSNPLLTSALGVLEFWAEEGEYWIHIDTASFRVAVGTPNTVDTFEVAASTISTGVVWGGTMNVNAGNPSAIDFAETVGYIVDYATDPIRPTVTRVHAPAQTVALVDVVSTVTHWLMDASGTIVQQAAPPTNAQRRTLIYLGNTAQFAGTIFEDQSLPIILSQPSNQFADLTEALGTFSISGNTITANGANLSVNTSGGSLFARAWNHSPDPNNPHVAPTFAASPAQFRRGLQNTTNFGVPVSVIDPANYDNAGVLTPVGGGANRTTIQRVYAFASNDQQDQMVILYGQTVYSSLADALAGISTEVFVTNPAVAEVGTLVALIVVIRTATNLSDSTQVRFIQVGKFGGGASATSAVGTDTTGSTRVVDKTADEPRTSNIVLSNDLHLAMSVSANARYTVEMYLDVEADPAADLAFGFTAPAGSSMSWSEGGVSLGTLNNIGSIKLNRNSLATASSIGAIAAGTGAMPLGRLTTGGAAGTLQFQFAQVVSSATPTILKAGSWLKMTRIA